MKMKRKDGTMTARIKLKINKKYYQIKKNDEK